MNDRRIGITGAAVTVVAIGGAVLWLGCSEAPEVASPEAPVSDASRPPPPDPMAPDVAGLPVLFPPGEEYPAIDISMDAYFEEFGGAEILDPETKQVRSDVAARIRDEMVGKQVTWDGYVQRVKNAPSGRVTVILGTKTLPTVNTAMIRFSAAWNDHIHGYEQGDRARVVAVYDAVVSVFPTLRGVSIELIPAEE